MSSLVQFLMDNPVDNITAEVKVSDRLNTFPFKIRGMSGKEFADYQKLSTTIGKHNKVNFDSKLFNEQVIINHTVEPNFKDAEMLKKAGCVSPEQFLYKFLLAGEIAELSKQISSLSGFDRDLEDTVDEAKNS